MKKLLMISNHYLTFVKDSVFYLSKNFDEINVMVRIHWYYYALKINKVIDLTDKPHNVNVMPTPILYLPMDAEYKRLGERHFKNVEKSIKHNNIKFDLISAHFTYSSGYVGAKLKEKYNKPFIVTAHGYDIYDLPFRDEEWKEKIKYVLNTADHIITVSKSNLECIKKLNVKTPVEVIPNSFNCNLFYSVDSNRCKKNLNLLLDKKIILTVGNLEEVKGHEYLIKAMAKIADKRQDVLCFIIGGGQLKAKLQKLINDLNLNNYVKLVGAKLHDEIPLWMNACDLFVLPSLRESFGIVQIEAMACGKPIVATRNGGSEEIIVNENLGYLVEPKNPDELAEKILLALNREWNKEYILRYVKKFRSDEMAKETFKVYEKVMK